MECKTRTPSNKPSPRARQKVVVDKRGSAKNTRWQAKKPSGVNKKPHGRGKFTQTKTTRVSPAKSSPHAGIKKTNGHKKLTPVSVETRFLSLYSVFDEVPEHFPWQHFNEIVKVSTHHSVAKVHVSKIKKCGVLGNVVDACCGFGVGDLKVFAESFNNVVAYEVDKLRAGTAARIVGNKVCMIRKSFMQAVADKPHCLEKAQCIYIDPPWDTLKLDGITIREVVSTLLQETAFGDLRVVAVKLPLDYQMALCRHQHVCTFANQKLILCVRDPNVLKHLADNYESDIQKRISTVKKKMENTPGSLVNTQMWARALEKHGPLNLPIWHKSCDGGMLNPHVMLIDVELNKENLIYLQKNFPEKQLAYTPKIKRCGSAHPLARTIREYSRKQGYLDVKDTPYIISVGDSGAKYAMLGCEGVHVSAPLMSDKDVMRHDFDFKSHSVRKCSCDAQKIMFGKCNHRWDDAEYNNENSAVIMLHSIYYFNLDDVRKILDRTKCIIATVHPFVGESGKYGECDWKRGPDDMVTMTVPDDDTVYSHRNVDWLFRPTVRDGYRCENARFVYKDWVYSWNKIRMTVHDWTYRIQRHPRTQTAHEFFFGRNIKPEVVREYIIAPNPPMRPPVENKSGEEERKEKMREIRKQIEVKAFNLGSYNDSLNHVNPTIERIVSGVDPELRTLDNLLLAGQWYREARIKIGAQIKANTENTVNYYNSLISYMKENRQIGLFDLIVKNVKVFMHVHNWIPLLILLLFMLNFYYHIPVLPFVLEMGKGMVLNDELRCFCVTMCCVHFAIEIKNFDWLGMYTPPHGDVAKALYLFGSTVVVYAIWTLMSIIASTPVIVAVVLALASIHYMRRGQSTYTLLCILLVVITLGTHTSAAFSESSSTTEPPPTYESWRQGTEFPGCKLWVNEGPENLTMIQNAFLRQQQQECRNIYCHKASFCREEVRRMAYQHCRHMWYRKHEPDRYSRLRFHTSYIGRWKPHHDVERFFYQAEPTNKCEGGPRERFSEYVGSRKPETTDNNHTRKNRREQNHRRSAETNWRDRFFECLESLPEGYFTCWGFWLLVWTYLSIHKGMRPIFRKTLKAITIWQVLALFCLFIVGVDAKNEATIVSHGISWKLVATLVVFDIRAPPVHKYLYGNVEIFGECCFDNKLKTLHPTSKLIPTELPHAPCERQVACWGYGIAAKKYKGRISDSCVFTEQATIVNRMMFDLPKYKPEYRLDLETLKRLYNTVEKYKDTILNTSGFRMTEMYTHSQWVASLDAAKRRQMEQAIQQPYCPRDSRVKAFIKKELILGKSKSTDEHLNARLICATWERNHARWGDYIMSASKRLNRLWTWEGHFPIITYASGYNRDQLGRWYDEACTLIGERPVVYESDFTKFDFTHTKHHLRLEHEIIKLICPIPEIPQRVLDAMEDVLSSKGKLPKGTRFAFEGHRKSGYQDTTLGNSILNGLSHLLMVCDATGCTPKELVDQRIPVRMVILGDDCYIMTTNALAHKFMSSTTIADLGWLATRRICETYEAGFCSSFFMPSKEGTILTGSPARVIIKTFFSTKRLLTEKRQSNYANGIAYGMLMEHAHNPLLNKLMERIEVLTVSDKRWFCKFKQNRHRAKAIKHHTPSDATYEFIFNRYGLTRREIEDWQDYCSKIMDYRVELDHPVLDRIIEVDIGFSAYEHEEVGNEREWRRIPLNIEF